MDRSSQDIDLESLGSTDSAQHQQVPERAVSRTDTNTDEAALEEFEPSILERAVDSIWGRFSSCDGSGQVTHPDRGWRPWCIILSCHLIFMNTCGWVNSSGVFQMYYTENTSLPAGKISWVGSIGAYFLFFVGALTSCLVYANTVRWIFSIGIILQFFGLILTSVCREYWQYLLAQGVLIGLGHGLIFCPALAVLSTDFATRRPLEIGFAACGSVMGGTMFSGIVRLLLPNLGYEWTLVVVSSVKLVTLVLALILVKPKAKPCQSHPIIGFAMFKDTEYIMFVVASFFTTMGVHIAYYFLALYSRTAFNAPLSSEKSLYLLVIFNGIGIVGYFATFVASHVYGIINVSTLVTLAASLFIYFWIAVQNSVGLYVWSAFYGIVAAAVQSLLSTGASSFTEGQDRRGVRASVTFMIASIAALTGPSIADAIIELQGGYMGAQVFGGSVTLLGFAILAAAKIRWMKRTSVGWLEKI
ncbi:hypothetical protein FPSE_10786 [Fusarium pseudograminearum CS3096]|uniref:Major facilitator superfamily (MFS) profile domain-containing protein n=1 Tax=Fusarium pseudograminearum (strain CS3096) TaxID=1028729 RepID=K3V6L5_FUSPC|nr:hypothetical protein FPSE_10786 [Fusarium pseudograminearum CS3096]EKJ69027.1 hypothetical protein FPSE_10786 [Fusarium pseudograminearum CS3096]KAF0644334.1 hypothetical protein FPSE5266_10786 [Fusarium pseudograminearum]